MLFIFAIVLVPEHNRGTVIIVLCVAPVAIWRFRKVRHKLTACGTAAWATISDVQRAGMFCKQGLILGRIPGDRRTLWKTFKTLLNPRVEAKDACMEFMDWLNINKRKEGRLVQLPQAVHTAVFAPTGVGKGVSCIVPFLMTCQDSCVVIDFKAENAHLTAAHRRAMGHRVVILDPYKVVTDKPDTFNPLDFINPQSDTALDDCRDIAEAMVIRTGEEKDPHWNDSAESVIGALIATTVHLGQKDKGTLSLQMVSDLLSSPKLMELSKQKMRELGGLLERWGGQLEHIKGDEMNSVFSTANRHLRFLNTPAIGESTRTSSFDPSMLKKEKMTIYLVLPPDRMRAQAGLLRLWIGSLFRAIIQCGLEESKKVHFVLDESAALGSMQQLDDAIDKYRGYGIRLQLYYQSLGQLKGCFPRDQGQTLLSNTTKVFFGVNDIETAQFVSKTLGNETILVRGWGSSSGWGTNRSTSSGHGYSESSSTSDSGGASSDEKQQARLLKTPEEVIGLDQRLAITLTPGLRPLMTRLIRYFEEPGLFRRSSWWRRLANAFRMMIVSWVIVAVAVFLAIFVTLMLQAAIKDQQVPESPYSPIYGSPVLPFPQSPVYQPLPFYPQRRP